jgi:acylphosphatase
VGFRLAAQRQAAALGLTGRVRNCADGSVEAVVQGDDIVVAQFLSWARNGPSMADVDRIDVDREPPDEGLTSFRIEH